MGRWVRCHRLILLCGRHIIPIPCCRLIMFTGSCGYWPPGLPSPPSKRPLPLLLIDCQFHLARTPPSTSDATAGSDQVPQQLPMGITFPVINTYSPCPSVDTLLMEVGAGISISGGRVDALRCACLPSMLDPVLPLHCRLSPTPLPLLFAPPFLLATRPLIKLPPHSSQPPLVCSSSLVVAHCPLIHSPPPPLVT